MIIKGKIALVTGASKGIGKSTAIELAKEGATVVVDYFSDKEAADLVVTECNKYSHNNISIKADVTNEQEVCSLFSFIIEKFNTLDILVNNAGQYKESDNPADTDLLEKMYRYNLLSQLRIIDHALKLMKKGKIINMSSIYGKLGFGIPDGAAFAAIKAGIESYTKTLAKKLAPDILINAVEPGYTLTPQWGNLSSSDIAKYSSRTLINRFIQPEEIAKTVIFLIQNDAITGEIILVDGGMSLKN